MSNLNHANLDKTDLTNAKNITYKPLFNLYGEVKCVALSKDNKFIVSGAGDYGNTVIVWDRETGENTDLDPHKENLREVNCVAISEDNKYIIAGYASYHKKIIVWERENVTVHQELKFYDNSAVCSVAIT